MIAPGAVALADDAGAVVGRDVSAQRGPVRGHRRLRGAVLLLALVVHTVQLAQVQVLDGVPAGDPAAVVGGRVEVVHAPVQREKLIVAL